MSDPMTDRQAPPRQGLQFLPKAAWAGLIIGVLGFALTIGTSSSTSVNGHVTQCSAINFGAFAVALAVLVCLVLTWQRRAKQHLTYRPSGTLMVIVSVVLGLLVVLQVLRGFGLIMPPC